jgi:hypothetical protein
MFMTIVFFSVGGYLELLQRLLSNLKKKCRHQAAAALLTAQMASSQLLALAISHKRSFALRCSVTLTSTTSPPRPNVRDRHSSPRALSIAKALLGFWQVAHGASKK